MPGYSLIEGTLSTVLFPYQGSDSFQRAVIVPFMGNNLKRLRAGKGWTLDEAASAMSMSRGGYIKIERGENQLTTNTIAKAAEVYSVPAGEVLAMNVIPVVGLVSAGGSVETGTENLSEPLYEVEIPVALSVDAMGFEVRGDSMWPRFDAGDVIVVSREGEAIEDVLGWDAVVTASDGNRYFKRVVRGSGENVYDLESYNAPTMRNVLIIWASSRIITIPARHIKTKAFRNAKKNFPATQRRPAV